MIRASEIADKQKENYEREKNTLIARIVDDLDRELIANYDPMEEKTCVLWPKWLKHAFSQAVIEALRLYEANGWKTNIKRCYSPLSNPPGTVVLIEFINPFRVDPRINLQANPQAPSNPSE